VEDLSAFDPDDRDHGAERHRPALAVRGGGHSIASLSAIQGGVLLDLAPMRGVQVDPERRPAVVQGGALWADVDRETQAFGLVAPGGVVSETGVAGLTLGGGYGWVRRQYGVSVDQLLEAQIVGGRRSGPHGVRPAPLRAVLSDTRRRRELRRRDVVRLRAAAAGADHQLLRGCGRPGRQSRHFGTGGVYLNFTGLADEATSAGVDRRRGSLRGSRSRRLGRRPIDTRPSVSVERARLITSSASTSASLPPGSSSRARRSRADSPTSSANRRWHLTRWRMTLAARRLKATSDSVEAIAHAVGYTSEYAFNRAFIRHRGQPPGGYRRGA
jgi:hypothetical protein